MHAIWRNRSSKFQSLISSRTQLAFLGKVFFCQAKANFGDSEIRGSLSLKAVERFPNLPDNKEKPVAPLPTSLSPSLIDPKKLKAISRVSEIGSSGKLQPQVLYLIELGLDLDQIKGITRRFTAFAFYSLEGKIKPLVEFLLDIGVSKSDIPSVLSRAPQLCGLSLSKNIVPTLQFLESLGVDKKQWAKVINRFPQVLCHSLQKVKSNVDFLCEMGLSAESIAKILIRCPNMVSLSIEANLKLVTEFFLERGYSMEDIGTMLSRFGALYSYSLEENLKPKWDFFLTMDYPHSELVKIPAYFGCSLEQRIKPRYALMKECGVMLPLSTLLSLSNDHFDKALKMKMKKKKKNLLTTIKVTAANHIFHNETCKEHYGSSNGRDTTNAALSKQ